MSAASACSADSEGPESLDALVVGAGFGGINALHNLRSHGYRAVMVERGDGIGGTWFWNRYPGARVDIESLEYSYGFSDELQQEWDWREKYAGHSEVRRYLNWVADRLGLRQDMRFGRTVTAAVWNDRARRWTVRGHGPQGQWNLDVRFLILATGFLSQPAMPDIAGIDEFEGVLVHTGAWPVNGVDLAGRTVGVLGTAASGVQVIQEVAPIVDRLFVFQRTPNWCFPLRNRPMDPAYQDFVKANYAKIRRLAVENRGPGTVLMGGEIVLPESRKTMDVAESERIADFERRWEAGGPHMGRSFTDLIISEEANAELRKFFESKIRGLVDDPAIAAKLIPDHPPLTRRPPGESGYYVTFNRDNVELVDVRTDEIECVRGHSVVLASGRRIGLDVLICATGYDSGTGALMRIDCTGVGGVKLREQWAHGARTHLGMMITNFPNLFLINGPQSPSAHFSPPVLAHYQMGHVLSLMERVDACGRPASIEPLKWAEDAWVDHLSAVYERTLIPKTDSWWTNANIAGKPRQFLNYGGGFPEYKRRAEAAYTNMSEYRVSCEEL